MVRFWRQFWPFQAWRFLVINTKMLLIAKGLIGPGEH